MSKNKKSIIFIFLILLTFFACEIKVPINEMVKARLSINRAKEVKAEKYNKNNIESAISALKECHDYIKDEKVEDAEKAAKRSLRKSKIAIRKSLPPLAKETLTEAKTIYREADDLNSKKNAPEEFMRAEGEIKNADDLNNNKKYWDSYLKSKEAIVSASAAMEKSLAVIPALKNRLNSLYNEKDALRSHKFNKIADTELLQAKSGLGSAEKLLGKKALKDVDSLLSGAEVNLNQARKKIEEAVNNEKNMLSLNERIDNLNNEVKALNKNSDKSFAQKEIDDSFVLLNDAKSLVEKKEYKTINNKLSDVEKNIQSARKKIEIGAAEKKFNSTLELLETVRLKDTNSDYVTEIERASIMVAGSKELLDKKLYNDSIKKSTEAESILIVIKEAIDNTGKVDTAKLEDGKEKVTPKDMDIQIYVVTYRKKNTDCLWRISLSVYKNAKLWPLIYKANRNIIKDPDLIFPGQKFVIPSLKSEKEIIDNKKMGKDKSKKSDEKNVKNVKNNTNDNKSSE